jgi:TRAP-type C4-dicarboxylate transport system permease large subunit
VYARATVREFFVSLGRALAAMLTPVVIIGGVAGGFFTPTGAAVVAVLYSFVFGMIIYRSLGVKEIKDVLYNTTRLASISLFCIGTASAFGWVMAYYQIPRLVVQTLTQYGIGVTSVGMHPVHLGIIGVISPAFGLVTPPYGLCLLIDVAIARTTVAAVIKDVAIILVPMLIALLLVILFPEVVLFVPKRFMPKFV